MLGLLIEFCFGAFILPNQNLFPKYVSGNSNNEFRHGTASTPPHCRVRQCASVPAVPPRPRPATVSMQGLFRAGFFWIVWAVSGLRRVSPLREKLAEFTAVLSILYLYLFIIIRLGHSFGLVPLQTSVFI